ncbi:MAG: hypothetical protein L6Q71_07065, partial [Planctomycetes bacterium]|nr:hypothetical protein [Planctomycetota bacterium]
TGTARGEAVGTGASLLSRIDQDLRQMAGGNGGRLVCGQDPMGRMFIAFIRNLPEERTTLGGYYSGSERIESGYADMWRGQS